MRKGWVIAGGIVALTAAAGALIWQRAPGLSSAERLTMGKAVYDAQCASCHGANLEGQPDWRERLPSGRLPAPPHDASGHTWHHDDAFLFGITKHGPAPYAPPGYESDMPGFADKLSDEQIRSVIAYIKSTWPPQIQERQAAITAQSQGRR